MRSWWVYRNSKTKFLMYSLPRPDDRLRLQPREPGGHAGAVERSLRADGGGHEPRLRHQYTQILGDGAATLSHDANGNLTSDGSTAFVYDAENRLVRASGALSLIHI